jgi:ABC-2 type transport system ATP-binding protein
LPAFGGENYLPLAVRPFTVSAAGSGADATKNAMNVESESGGSKADNGQRPDASPAPVVLRALGLRRSFGKVAAVDGLDLTVRAGEIYGFLGVNGAGKTTSIRMLMGIIKPEDGMIELLGERTRRTTIRQKQAIGYVSQEQTFYPWMTARGLGRFVGGFYPSWDAPEFERLLRVLDVPPDRKSSQLSGGMRVKLALALALASRPALLILDEPTSGLDPLARREFLDHIQQQARDHHRTTFFSSHIIEEIERVADRVGIIHHGRMRYEGDLKTLRATVRLVRFPPGAPRPPELPVLPTDAPPIIRHAQIPPPLPFFAASESSAAVAFAPPTGFDVLRDETRDGWRSLVLRAEPSAWAAFDLPGAEISDLSLEDIFIAMVRTGVMAI